MRGALFGAAIGDAVGLTHEFSAPEAIPDPPYEVIGGGPFRFAAGDVSDDTDLLLVSLRSYVNGDAFDPKICVEELIRWLAAGPADVGNQTRSAIVCWSKGRAPSSEPEAQGNGGLMRAAAHAVACNSAELAGANAASDTMLTHPSETAARTSHYYASFLWRLIREGKADLQQDHRFRPYSEPQSSMGGHCIHSLRLALWSVVHAHTFEDGINAIIASGGDTDTNAAIAGALLGARFGFSAIPTRWLSRLSNKISMQLDAHLARFA